MHTEGERTLETGGPAGAQPVACCNDRHTGDRKAEGEEFNSPSDPEIFLGTSNKRNPLCECSQNAYPVPRLFFTLTKFLIVKVMRH